MKVLYLSYFSPPHLHAAANRSQRFAQYLARTGCEVQLVREQCTSRFSRQESPACWQHEALIANQAIVSWNIEWLWRRQENVHWGWVIPSLWQCCLHIMANRPDVIMVSCPPFSSSLVGYYLSRWFDLPLVLDFQDGWSRASYFAAGKISCWEKLALKQATKLVVTSQSDWIAYQRLVGEDKVVWIPNSYDFVLNHASKNNTVFTLGYCGTWDSFRRSAKGILCQLAAAPFSFRFINIGDSQPDFVALVEQYALTDSVVMIGQVEKKQGQDVLAQCDALFIQNGPPDRGKKDTHLAAKAVDYVASGRPILAELPEGETLSFLRRYAGKLHEVNIGDPEGYQQQLNALYQQWQQNPQQVYRSSDEFYQAFDARVLASRLYRILNEARA
ncbi:hypothetical protein L4D08_10210 [Photobacterium chitinilyticum]|uniref:glycosyltransferase n=1 Tax=Photobacterium chitinilyticum TaxID=2485123 RepID=UPI003D09A826